MVALRLRVVFENRAVERHYDVLADVMVSPDEFYASGSGSTPAVRNASRSAVLVTGGRVATPNDQEPGASVPESERSSRRV
jgi:hypothetical protein